MKKMLMVLGLAVVVGMTGCTAAKAEQEVNTVVAELEAAPAVVKEAVAVEVVQEQEKSIAIEYVELFLNSSDKEAQTKFSKEKIIETNQPFYDTLIALGRAEPTLYNDPKVIETLKIDDKGKAWEYVLVIDGEGKEVIVITVDGKFSGAIMQGQNDKDKKIYSSVRDKFKTATN